MKTTPLSANPPIADAPLETLPNSPTRLRTLVERVRPTPEAVVLLLAVLIGTGAGAGVVLFRTLIHVMRDLMFGQVSSLLSVWGHWTIALIPVMGGLIVGGLRLWFKDFGPGLKTLIEVAQGKRELQPLNPLTKMAAASISLGSGASLGPEGPSVEIGAYFSLLLGQVLKVSQERQRLLLSAGAAAGLAAGFNAPIAGVFFALEVVLGSTFVVSSASVVLLAAVVAAWIAQIGLGSQPAFALPAYEVRSLLELPLYVGLGLLASLTSLLHVRLLRLSQHCFQGDIPGLQWLAKIPQPLHPVIGGLCLGLIALKLPQILGIGYETVEAMLQDVQFPLQLVIALLLAKLVMTAISFGSGFVGGVFAPALFLGASLGSGYGKILAIALPMLRDYIALPPAYAMVGMAAVLAASVRAPLTAILLLFELTHDYRIVLPLMAAVGLSSWVMEQQLGSQVVIDNTPKPATPAPPIPLPPPSPLTVGEAMHPTPLALLGSCSLLEAGQALVERRRFSALIMNEQDELIGILTLTDVNKLLSRSKPVLQIHSQAHSQIHPQTHSQSHSQAHHEEQSDESIESLCAKDMIYAYEDEQVNEAIARMITRGLRQIPVVSRENPRKVVGLLDQDDIELAEMLAVTKEILDRHQALVNQAISEHDESDLDESDLDKLELDEVELDEPELNESELDKLELSKSVVPKAS